MFLLDIFNKYTLHVSSIVTFQYKVIMFMYCSNIDKLGEDVIPQEAFRAAIESRFNLELSNDQFTALLDRVPLNEEGAVKYAEFMSQFDTK